MNMSVITIAKRYASALLQLGKDEKKIESFKENLNDLTAVLIDNDEMRNVMLNPKISKIDKNKVLTTISGKVECHKHVENLARLLIRKGRIEILGEVNKKFNELAMQTLGIAPATITTYDEIDENTKKSLTESLEKITKKKIIPTYETDKAILGGIVMRIGSLKFDGSIQNHFNRIRKSIL